MTKHSGYLINVLLTNGDIFALNYATMESARISWSRLERNPLVVHASLHDRNDREIAEISNA
jgi:hypothetical protein